MELVDFISQNNSEFDLDLINIESDTFKSLSVERQHEIILDLKNASRYH